MDRRGCDVKYLEQSLWLATTEDLVLYPFFLGAIVVWEMLEKRIHVYNNN